MKILVDEVTEEDLDTIETIEKLWKHFVVEAVDFTPDQTDVIDKEFWNLG
jgi:hypothetical protein